MSRSGYTYDDLGDPLEFGRWRQAVKKAIEGKRGQALLRELAEALDAMPDRRLYPGNFATPDGEFCALGVLAAKRGVAVDDLGDAEHGCDFEHVGQRFGIAPSMAAEIMDMNDGFASDCWKWVNVVICGPMPPYHFGSFGPKHHERNVRIRDENHPQERWRRVREWVAENIKE